MAVVQACATNAAHATKDEVAITVTAFALEGVNRAKRVL